MSEKLQTLSSRQNSSIRGASKTGGRFKKKTVIGLGLTLTVTLIPNPNPKKAFF